MIVGGTESQLTGLQQDFKSATSSAMPKQQFKRLILMDKMVGRAGFEPATNWLKAHGSPTEITNHTWHTMNLDQLK